jgi:hypothetical protein
MYGLSMLEHRPLGAYFTIINTLKEIMFRKLEIKKNNNKLLVPHLITRHVSQICRRVL